MRKSELELNECKYFKRINGNTLQDRLNILYESLSDLGKDYPTESDIHTMMCDIRFNYGQDIDLMVEENAALKSEVKRLKNILKYGLDGK